ncbi:hypothetical protein ABL78_1361 [Leptomonas seymouri]|uniref:Nuclear pore complex protein n=1 Tax=Leptomonas seymouri TaxID=5684 RepID=A0A0N1IAQ9_LEPSE|nr:hypothetical protein ABL78_1361 [Leptomonas seymouri]|eukprot:KPI89485.1 hypothetical protein ABL78_1361 [Leptomonas seymouri]
MTDYEQRYGKVDMTASWPATRVHDRPLPVDRGALAVVPAASSALHGSLSKGATTPATSPLRTYAEWYLNHSSATSPIRTVPTVEHFKQESRVAGRKQEAYLWSLMQDIYADAEQADQYHPDAIGIELVQPHRRWFISQYAHLQVFLQRQPVLRRANIICRWLEATYREDSRLEPRLRGEEEIVFRQLILTYIRGGELHRAIQAAVTYESCVHSCLLSAAQLQTVQEPWFSQTALVPLFGEYAHGELDQAWCGNEYRLENLSQLYEESLRYRSTEAAVGVKGSAVRPTSNASNDFDAVIGAALCGNLDVLEAAFKVNGNWKDVAWCYLRCALVVAFTKQLMVAMGAGGDEAGRAAVGVVDGRYAAFIEGMTGSGDDWAATFSQKLVQGLATRLQSGFLAHAPLEEQLQMRLVLQTLTCMDGRGSSGLPFAGPSAAVTLRPPPPPAAAVAAAGVPTEWFDVVAEEGNSEAARLITHVVLAQDVAYGETLSPHSVQVRAGAALATSLARYAVFLALLPRYPFDEGLRAVTAMTLRLRDPRHRAGVYAAFIKAAREYELERRDLARSQLEEQEALLVRQFVTTDTDSQVHVEVQRLLYQQVAPTEMLTHNRVAEKIMWEAMHANSISDYVRVLRGGLTACCSFWLAQPEPEVEAIADVSSILTRRVMPELQKMIEKCDEDGAVAVTSQSCSPMTELERSEATFWHLLSEARGTAKRHTTTAAELRGARANAAFAGAAAGPPNRTLVYQLTQDQTTLLNRLVEQTQQAVRHGGAVVHRDRQCLTAIIWLVKQLTEEVALSMLSNRPVSEAEEEAESPAPRDELHRMQQVYGLLEELHQAGYLEPELLSQKCASDLYMQIRTMRVSYGQQVHKRQVMAVLRARAVRQIEDAKALTKS